MKRNRNNEKRLEQILNIMIVIVLAVLITCTILTTRWVSDLKIMATDSLNTLNEINVQVEEIKAQQQETDPNEALINHYSQLMPMEYCLYTVRTAEAYGVDPKEIFAMIEKESDFDPGAVSTTGDYGLMQINKSNLPAIEKTFGEVNLLDPY